MFLENRLGRLANEQKRDCKQRRVKILERIQLCRKHSSNYGWTPRLEKPAYPKIATPFGGGMARSGSICGCVTGALMYIGLKLGRTQCTEDREKAYAFAASFLSAFERKFGSLICYELIGCDFRTPEGHKRWEELKESRCANFVKGTVEILLNLEKQAIK